MDWHIKVERPSSVSCHLTWCACAWGLSPLPRPLLCLSNSCKILKYQSLKDKDKFLDLDGGETWTSLRAGNPDS